MVDLWFARDDDVLYSVMAPAGEPPTTRPIRVTSVHEAVAAVRLSGIEIAEIGICPPDMIGIH